ncbi:MAG: serine hydrolase [Asticcacaulis sp.]|nr:serine hydrolase [Asticcacaulis sp.]
MRRIGWIFKRAGETISNGNKGLKAAVLAASAVFLIALPAAAQDLTDNARYAAIVVDAQSGEVFYAQRADSARYPASLTKIMTLYMAFDALAHGTLKPTDQITMSAHATSQAPVKVYLRPGDTIDVDTAMRLIALYSANDLAVALAEKDRRRLRGTLRRHDDDQGAGTGHDAYALRQRQRPARSAPDILGPRPGHPGARRDARLSAVL